MKLRKFRSSKYQSTSGDPRRDELEILYGKWQFCERCEIGNYRNNVVMWRGNPNAHVMFIGEAPGRDEDLKGVPFVGKAGEILEKLMKEYGFNSENSFICNVVACRPCDGPDDPNRTPVRDEIDNCKPRLLRMIQIVKPDLIMLLGNTAARAVFPDAPRFPTGVKMKDDGREVSVHKSFHPAAFLYGAISEQLHKFNAAKIDWSRFREAFWRLRRRSP